MIARRWTARATLEGAREYEVHFRESVLPELSRVGGHRGAYLFRHVEGDRVDLTVITMWESMEAIRAFAGDMPGRAVVEPRARDVLDGFDETVVHHDVVVDTVR